MAYKLVTLMALSLVAANTHPTSFQDRAIAHHSREPLRAQAESAAKDRRLSLPKAIEMPSALAKRQKKAGEHLPKPSVRSEEPGYYQQASDYLNKSLGDGDERSYYQRASDYVSKPAKGDDDQADGAQAKREEPGYYQKASDYLSKSLSDGDERSYYQRASDYLSKPRKGTDSPTNEDASPPQGAGEAAGSEEPSPDQDDGHEPSDTPAEPSRKASDFFKPANATYSSYMRKVQDYYKKAAPAKPMPDYSPSP